MKQTQQKSASTRKEAPKTWNKRKGNPKKASDKTGKRTQGQKGNSPIDEWANASNDDTAATAVTPMRPGTENS